MARVSSFEDKEVLEKFRDLPDEKKRELVDFLDFLSAREKVTKWIEFDAWTLNLAKAKGFSNLTEADVARIVSEFREGE